MTTGTDWLMSQLGHQRHINALRAARAMCTHGAECREARADAIDAVLDQWLAQDQAERDDADPRP